MIEYTHLTTRAGMINPIALHRRIRSSSIRPFQSQPTSALQTSTRRSVLTPDMSIPRAEPGIGRQPGTDPTTSRKSGNDEPPPIYRGKSYRSKIPSSGRCGLPHAAHFSIRGTISPHWSGLGSVAFGSAERNDIQFLGLRSA